jgi:predicted PurR-regulated permease PerM
MLDWFQRRGFNVPNRDGLLDAVDPGAALGFAAVLLNEVGALLTNGVLILLTVVFILLEVGSFRYKLRRAIGAPRATFPPVAAFMDGMKRYFVIKTEVSLITGTLVAVWLAVLGVDFPLLWGLIAFLFNYVPNIGSIIAAIPATLLALVQLGLWPAFLVAAGYLAINMVMGNFLEPRWMGHGVGLSPLVVFFSLIAWGWVLGPVGLLLSVPLTMTVKIAAESFPETRWLAVLLGPEDVPPGEDAPELEEAGIDADALDAATARAEAARAEVTETETA